mmetsp:Transcript_17044/g.48704  ORF Transcript_17044/g.48704 Transcript_17044/m.48704 type:complete len:200 (+) Transcript_17044:768-1367(+)
MKAGARALVLCRCGLGARALGCARGAPPLLGEARRGQRAPVVDAMHDLGGQLQQQVAPEVIVGVLQAHLEGLVRLVGVPIVAYAVALHSGLDRVVALHLADLEHEVQCAIDLLDDSVLAEQDHVCAFLGARQPHEYGADDDGVEKVGDQRLDRQQPRPLPTIVVVRVGYAVADRHEGLQREVKCARVLSFDRQIAVLGY